MRWYYAPGTDSELWDLGGMSREEAIAAGRSDFCGEPFYVAPEMSDQSPDPAFFRAVAQAIRGGFERAEETLTEDGWIDPEEPWLGWLIADELEEKLGEWLPTVLERPEWRTVDVEVAELIEEVTDD